MMEEQNTILAVASSCLFFPVIFVEETHPLFASEGTEEFHSQETYYTATWYRTFWKEKFCTGDNLC